MGNDESHALREIALLVRHVPSAISSVVSLRSDQTLAEAQTLMSANEYSQLAAEQKGYCRRNRVRRGAASQPRVPGSRRW
jgi:hypothetical protein